MDDVVAVVTDLFFQSRIAAAARHAHRQVHFVHSERALLDLDSVDTAMVDLDARTDVLSMIRTLKERTAGPVIAFGPHLDTEKRKAARAAGADRVLAKSKFVTELPVLMAAHGAARQESDPSRTKAAGSATKE
jgi:CheY-like chemotaxis protein